MTPAWLTLSDVYVKVPRTIAGRTMRLAYCTGPGLGLSMEDHG